MTREARGDAHSAELDRIAEEAASVPDPEMPMLTLRDLGILRGVERDADGRPVVVVTPTYSGCPAMEAIRADVRERLERLGHPGAEVRTVLSPPWSTDWITEEGRRKLAEHGIAPPSGAAPVGPVPVRLSVKCPRCGSPETRTLSRFGSTACKELRVCEGCKEPFDHVKPL
ncbi:phenylacetate-CoA oxygenase subunit PaaJ [Nocardiopsis sp. LSu2-4]|uniref:Phenylacetate-CoA oxygenase subunit PaaJ n=1 Tax=Nocardiopsis suaedae TaxID=3018444 RepID=A0ABT4TS21_9ACTN|nr:1,2-phenylacetyl-CoA epoxidase subunit PaaD [Nocardiopsis suaedae]MDA2807472.1 phenylacetate-CoA oxygenase subunit PaaJ [Nocardiopsis suaedae]